MDARGEDAERLRSALVQAMKVCGFRGCGEGPTTSDKQDYALMKLIARVQGSLRA